MSQRSIHLLAFLAVCLLMSALLSPQVRADEGNPEAGPMVHHPAAPSDTVRGYLWNDANCDGIRQGMEGALPDSVNSGYRLSLIYIGNDGTPFTSDDNEIGFASAGNGLIEYFTFDGGGDYTYYFTMRPNDRPAGFVPSLVYGDTVDNKMYVLPNGGWATPTFVIPLGAGFSSGPGAIRGPDVGLCAVSSLPMPYRVSLPLVTR